MHSAVLRENDSGDVERKGITPEQLSAEEAAGFALPSAEVLRGRVRYFSDGLVLGNGGFVAEVFARSGARLKVKRQIGPRVPKGCDLGGLRTLKDLRGLSAAASDEH